MIFSINKNKGLAGLKTAVGEEGAISERMRLQYMKEQRNKQESQRVKTSIIDKKIILDRNKLAVSRRQIEIRRLTAEITRSEIMLHEIEMDIANYDVLISGIQKKHTEILFQINTHKKEIDQQRDSVNAENRNIHHYEEEIKVLEIKMIHERDMAHQINKNIEKISIEIAHLINDASKAQMDVSHSHGNRIYKEKEFENRKRNFTFLSSKKDEELKEVARINGENAKLEHEIQSLGHEVVNYQKHD